MNDYARLAGHDRESDPLTLSLRLANTPFGPLDTRYGFPDRELAALVRDWGRRFSQMETP